MFAAYCPNPPTGVFLVYSQQRIFFLLKGDNWCPRIAFIQDLGRHIQEAQENGDRVILMLDGNMDMRESPLSLELKARGLEENSKTARDQWSSHVLAQYQGESKRWHLGIKRSKSFSGGYLDYEQVILTAEHRCVWIDITFREVFGNNMPAVMRPFTRCLHYKDPRNISNYVKLCESQARKQQLLHRTQQLEKRITYPATVEIQKEYKSIDAMRCDITRFAEKRCRKLRKGQVAFSLELQQASRAIAAYSLLQKRQAGGKSQLETTEKDLKKSKTSSSMQIVF